MNYFPFAIKSSRIVTPEGILKGYVLVEKGIITDISAHQPEAFLLKVRDVGNKVVMPGITDPHVHINEPGRTYWEGFETATRAAAAGGITTLVDMPLNASPVTTTVAAYKEKQHAARFKITANVGFWGGLVPGNTHEIEPLIIAGVLGFKAFLTHSGIDEFPNVTEKDLRLAMPIIAKHNLPLLVHCELADNIKRETINSQSYQEYLASRPKDWEDKAIAMMIRLCEEFNCRVHIVHLSSASSLPQIKEARDKGLPLTVETAQHYLYFNAEDIPDGNTAFKCAPPIRERANNELLWGALLDGTIDFVATDHSPAPPDIKELKSGDLTKAWGGIASVQLALPVLWTAAQKHGATLNDLALWLCENPTKLAGTAGYKGKIKKGYDADLVIWDTEKKFTVSEVRLWHRHKTTPYKGEVLSGVVEQTYLAGEKIYLNSAFRRLHLGKLLKNTHERL